MVIAGSAFVASIWAVRVPPFQQPDEVAHADYAFAFFDAGKPFWRHGVSANYVTPQVRYLIRATDYRRIRYDVRAIEPSGFESHTWDRRVDRAAPFPAFKTPDIGSKRPYAMFAYPPFYYIVIAAAMKAAWNASGQSLLVTFLAARLLNVVLLVATLATSLCILVELGFTRLQRILTLIALGFFPLDSWMSGYIQPDNLSALGIALCWLAALRLKRYPASIRELASLMLCEVVLSFTKTHYAAVTIIAIGLALHRSIPKNTRVRSYAMLWLIPSIALLCAGHTLPGGWFGGPTLAPDLHDEALVPRVVSILEHSLRLFYDSYIGGSIFDGFWFHFGLRAGRIFSGMPLHILSAVLVSLTILSITIVGANQLSNIRRIVRISRLRGVSNIARFVGNDITLNLNVCLTGLLFSLNIFAGSALSLQGRYWYPILLSIIVLSVTSVSRAFGRARYKSVLTIACATWATYSLVASPCALASMNRDFYETKLTTKSLEIGELTAATLTDVPLPRDGSARVPRTGPIRIEGVALDTSRGSIAKDIRYRIDTGPLVRARSGYRNVRLSQLFNDPELVRAGFRTTINLSTLRPGLHAVSFFSKEGSQAFPFAEFHFTITRS